MTNIRLILSSLALFAISFGATILLLPDPVFACDACDVLTEAGCGDSGCLIGECYDPTGGNTCLCDHLTGPCLTGSCGRTTFFFTDQVEFEVTSGCSTLRQCVTFCCCEKTEYSVSFEFDGLWGGAAVIICCDK